MHQCDQRLHLAMLALKAARLEELVVELAEELAAAAVIVVVIVAARHQTSRAQRIQNCGSYALASAAVATSRADFPKHRAICNTIQKHTNRESGLAVRV